MITRRMERVDSEVNKAIGQIIQYELSDPRLSGVMISTLKSEVTKDMKYCKTCISVFPAEKGEEIIKVLNDCRPYIKKCLASKVLMRSIPQLNFVLDKGLEYSEHIEGILKELNIQGEQDDTETDNNEGEQ